MILKVKKPGEGHQHPKAGKVAAIVNSEGSARLNCNVSRELYREVKTFAAQNDLTITDMIRESIVEYMSKRDNK